jgi:hypothetical protein
MFKSEMMSLVCDRNIHSLKLGWARVNFNVIELVQNLLLFSMRFCAKYTYSSSRLFKMCSYFSVSHAHTYFNQYFLDEDEFTFVIEAIKQLATLGWRLLPHYQCDARTGQFTHRTFVPRPMSMGAMSFTAEGRVHYRAVELDAGLRANRRHLLTEAKELYLNAPAVARSQLGDFCTEPAASWTGKIKHKDLGDVDLHRWFPVSHDAMKHFADEEHAVVLKTSTIVVDDESKEEYEDSQHRHQSSLDRPLEQHKSLGLKI